MNLDYSYEILLDAPFNDESVRQIIQKGKNLGFVYLDRNDYCDDWDTVPSMNIEQVLKRIKYINENNDNNNFPKDLGIQYLDTSFVMTIENKNNIFISIYPICLWYKKCINFSFEIVDVARYIELLIELSNSFTILSIESDMLDDNYHTKVKKNVCKIVPNASFNEISIMEIIKKGETLGFQYLNQKNYTDQLDSLSTLNNKDVLKKIMTEALLKKTSKPSEFELVTFLLPSNIVVHYENTFFSLTFTQEDYNGLYIELLPIKNFWFIKSDEFSIEHIDIGRYLKLLIKLCEDFPCDDIRGSVL